MYLVTLGVGLLSSTKHPSSESLPTIPVGYCPTAVTASVKLYRTEAEAGAASTKDNAHVGIASMRFNSHKFYALDALGACSEGPQEWRRSKQEGA